MVSLGSSFTAFVVALEVGGFVVMRRHSASSSGFHLSSGLVVTLLSHISWLRHKHLFSSLLIVAVVPIPLHLVFLFVIPFILFSSISSILFPSIISPLSVRLALSFLFIPSSAALSISSLLFL
jgi:hypothetical protein